MAGVRVAVLEVEASDPVVPAQAAAAVRSDRERLRHGATIALLLSPAAATLALSFATAGTGTSPALAAIGAVAVAIGLRTAGSRTPLGGLSRPVWVAGAALAVLAAWTGASLLWADGGATRGEALEHAVLYALVFWLFGSVGRRPGRMRVMVGGLAFAATAVALTALVLRLAPGLADVPLGGQTDRLSYPLGHWNAVGFIAGLALLLCFHLAADELGPALLRVLGAALLPATALCLLLTSSRGAMACTALALVAYGVAARPRGFATAAAAALPTVGIICWVGYRTSEISGYAPTSSAAASEGGRVALILIGCTVAAAILRAALLPTDAAWARVRFGGSPARRRAIATGVAVGAIALAGAAGVAAGLPSRVAKAYDTFTGEHVVYRPGTGDRFTNFSSNDRLERWRAALHAAGRHPVEGLGIASFRFAPLPVRTFGKETDVELRERTDAGSLYLETLAELGIVGLLALVVAVGTLLIGVASRARGADRRVYGVVFAAVLFWAVHAGIDIDWKLPALSLWVFALGGAALAAPARRVGASPGRGGSAAGREAGGAGQRRSKSSGDRVRVSSRRSRCRYMGVPAGTEPCRRYSPS